MIRQYKLLKRQPGLKERVIASFDDHDDQPAEVLSVPADTDSIVLFEITEALQHAYRQGREDAISEVAGDG
jgi:hypothetical protein